MNDRRKKGISPETYKLLWIVNLILPGVGNMAVLGTKSLDKLSPVLLLGCLAFDAFFVPGGLFVKWVVAGTAFSLLGTYQLGRQSYERQQIDDSGNGSNYATEHFRHRLEEMESRWNQKAANSSMPSSASRSSRKKRAAPPSQADSQSSNTTDSANYRANTSTGSSSNIGGSKTRFSDDDASRLPGSSAPASTSAPAAGNIYSAPSAPQKDSGIPQISSPSAPLQPKSPVSRNVSKAVPAGEPQPEAPAQVKTPPSAAIAPASEEPKKELAPGEVHVEFGLGDYKFGLD